MIVFFGDHQPTTYVSNPILRNNKVNPETLTDEENLLKYKVPYVIWSNFDIEEQTDGRPVPIIWPWMCWRTVICRCLPCRAV